MANPVNKQVICDQLLSYAERTHDHFARVDIVAKILDIADRLVHLFFQKKRPACDSKSTLMRCSRCLNAKANFLSQELNYAVEFYGRLKQSELKTNILHNSSQCQRFY